MYIKKNKYLYDLNVNIFETTRYGCLLLYGLRGTVHLYTVNVTSSFLLQIRPYLNVVERMADAASTIQRMLSI